MKEAREVKRLVVYIWNVSSPVVPCPQSPMELTLG